MSENSAIPWTDHTFNPWWGCDPLGPECYHCYAETLAKRYGAEVWGAESPRRTFSDKHWREPEKWNTKAQERMTPEKVFCGSMCDWAEKHTIAKAERPRLWETVKRTPRLYWQLLTKRSSLIKRYIPEDWGDGWPNVWLGVSCGGNDWRSRLDHLREIPAVVRFVSCEPALMSYDKCDFTGIDWVICGGESGGKRRPFNRDWARYLRDLCRDQGIAFFFKQGSAFKPDQDYELDGEVIRQFPTPRGI